MPIDIKGWSSVHADGHQEVTGSAGAVGGSTRGAICHCRDDMEGGR